MTVRTTNFDALAAASPLDRQASVVRDGSGDHWEAKISKTQLRWLAPPPMKVVSALTAPGQLIAKSLIGKRVGRLVILGILNDGIERKSASWVVRCDCGYYEARKAKALREQRAGDDMACSACDKVNQLRELGRSQNTSASRMAAADRLDALTLAVRP